MTKVSVIVPVYNVERYLPECIESIIHQTLKDIEIICVDDGSKDSSLNILRQYEIKDSRIKVISKQNAGYGDSMNRGFNLASGDFIGIVESDDYVELDMFEKLYNCAVDNDCEIVKSDYYEFTTKTKRKQTLINTVFNESDYGIVLNYKTCPDLFHYKMNTWTGIYKRSFIELNGIKHNITPGAAYQDNGFWFQTLSLAKRILFYKGAFYHYRQDNPNSSINSKGKVFCMCDEYLYIEDFLNNHSDIQEELFLIYLTKKYFNYFYTYQRVSSEYKIMFLERMKCEFEKPFFEGIMNDSNTDKNILAILKRIIENPKKFYYEDTIWNLQHDCINNCIEYRKIESNCVYKLLRKLRLIQ